MLRRAECPSTRHSSSQECPCHRVGIQCPARLLRPRAGDMFVKRPAFSNPHHDRAPLLGSFSELHPTHLRTRSRGNLQHATDCIRPESRACGDHARRRPPPPRRDPPPPAPPPFRRACRFSSASSTSSADRPAWQHPLSRRESSRSAVRPPPRPTVDSAETRPRRITGTPRRRVRCRCTADLAHIDPRVPSMDKGAPPNFGLRCGDGMELSVHRAHRTPACAKPASDSSTASAEKARETTLSIRLASDSWATPD